MRSRSLWALSLLVREVATETGVPRWRGSTGRRRHWCELCGLAVPDDGCLQLFKAQVWAEWLLASFSIILQNSSIIAPSRSPSGSRFGSLRLTPKLPLCSCLTTFLVIWSPLHVCFTENPWKRAAAAEAQAFPSKTAEVPKLGNQQAWLFHPCYAKLTTLWFYHHVLHTALYALFVLVQGCCPLD